MKGRVRIQVFDVQVPDCVFGAPSGRQELVPQAGMGPQAIVVDELLVVRADLGTG